MSEDISKDPDLDLNAIDTSSPVPAAWAPQIADAVWDEGDVRDEDVNADG